MHAAMLQVYTRRLWRRGACDETVEARIVSRLTERKSSISCVLAVRHCLELLSTKAC